MPALAGSNAGLAFGDYSSSTAFSTLAGQFSTFDDVDLVGTVITKNSDNIRECVLVKNASASAITPGMALNFYTGTWGTGVQACPANKAIRCFAPSYVRGSTSTTIPAGAYFWAVKRGFTSPLSDGTAIAIDENLVVGATAGGVRTESPINNGVVYGIVADATVNTVSTQTVAVTSTFAANTLQVGDVVRVRAAGTIIRSSGTITILLLLGATTIVTTGAITNAATGDLFHIDAEFVIRTIGASGTVVADSVWADGIPGTVVPAPYTLASTTIDTTATQAVALAVTPSVSLAGNSVTVKEFTITKFGTALGGVRGGVAIAAAALGSAAQFRAAVNCNSW